MTFQTCWLPTVDDGYRHMLALIGQSSCAAPPSR
jgi:hypothetical protein